MYGQLRKQRCKHDSPGTLVFCRERLWWDSTEVTPARAPNTRGIGKILWLHQIGSEWPLSNSQGRSTSLFECDVLRIQLYSTREDFNWHSRVVLHGLSAKAELLVLCFMQYLFGNKNVPLRMSNTSTEAARLTLIYTEFACSEKKCSYA